MSSIYRPICLSHDPALVVDGWGETEWNNLDAALGAVTRRAEALQFHIGCDLLIARYSSPIVELICPAKTTIDAEARGAAYCWHTQPTSIDAAWLQLMIACLDQQTPAVEKAVDHIKALDHIRGCWQPRRVRRLTILLTE